MGVGLRPGAKAAGRATDPLPATRLPSTLHEWCRYPCATWSAPWTLWPRPTAPLLTWRRIDDYGAETRSPSLAKFNNERDNPATIGGTVAILRLLG